MKQNKNMILGLFFVLCAFLFLGSSLNLFPNVNIIQLLIIVFSAIFLVRSIITRRVWEALISFGVLYYVGSDYLNLPRLSLFTVAVTLVLLGIGISLLLPKSYAKYEKYTSNYNGDTSQQHSRSEFHGDIIDEEIAFGSRDKYISSQNFTRGDFEVVFSNMRLYLDQCQLQSDSAYIKVEVVFSSMTIYVPKEWAVSVNAEVIFSGNTVVGTPESPTKTITIVGEVVFSSLKIIYV